MGDDVSNGGLSGAELYLRLRREILSCHLRPGTQFRERELACRFNVSKTPVRDALIKLQEQNLVEAIPRRGYRIAPVSLTDARELYEARLIFEREALARLTEAAEPRALAGLDAFRSAPDCDSLAAWIDYNRGFHGYILAQSGNARLARIGIPLLEQFDRLTHMSLSARGPEGDSHLGRAERTAEHAAIIDAVQAGDRRRALALLRAHVEGSRQRLLEGLESTPVVP